jgi:hypothetical protein
MANTFTFLPDALPALVAAATDPPSGATRRSASYSIAVTANGSVAGTAIPLSAELLDAGDVVGVDPRMIARVDPRQSATAFEPNYMPLVEFVDADFPWRYSLDTAPSGRRKPWLVLIALTASEYAFADSGNAPLPRIRVPDAAQSLPDLTQCWAYAHVHISPDGTTPLDQFVRDRPERSYSRLLCPRRLAPNTAYSLFLVPVFEAGRLRGIGDAAAPPQWNALAWGARSGPVELPVYFQSRFETSVLEDFELLVRRLKPYHVSLDDPVAQPAIAFAGDPGYYSDYHNANATFQIQDALVKSEATVEPYNTDPLLGARLANTLAATIAGESVDAAEDGPNVDDPLVAMPAYGWRFRQENAPEEAKAQAEEWFDRVSLDLKFRQAAGLGAETVRRDQELYSAICWQQYEDIAKVNQRLSQLKTAAILAARMSIRHFERLTDDAALALAQPLHASAVVPGGSTVASVLRQAGLPVSLNSRSLRMTAAKRARTVTTVPAPASATTAAGGATAIAATSATVRVRVVPVPQPVPTGPISPAPGVPPISTVPIPPPVRTLPPAFRVIVGQLFDVALFEAPKLDPPLAVGIHDVDASALVGALATTLKSLPARKVSATLSGLSAAESGAMTPVQRGPVVPIPLSDRLATFAASAMLRNQDALPPNSVAVVQENRAFVEAFLVGANHEMNNELRWREFPTDMRGTIFARFWNRRRAPDDPLGDDIPPIRNWDATLGKNFAPHDDGEADFVLLLRSDFIRKFGTVEVVLTRLKDGATSWAPENVDDFPAGFSGTVGPDTAYYGFDVARETILGNPNRYFFAIYEPAGALRFGLDIATAGVRRTRFPYRVAALPFALKAMGRTPGDNPVPAHLQIGKPVSGNAATWDDLSWNDMVLDGAGYVDFVNSNPGVTETPALWSSARTSASLARSFLQKPVAAVLSATRVLQ